jgi:hypothetical protein
MEILVLTLLVASFAALVTVHVSLSFGLFTRGPWWYGLIALAVPPAAVYLGWREKLRIRSLLWVAAALVYVAARVVAEQAR